MDGNGEISALGEVTTPPAYAKSRKVSVDRVHRWIQSGELLAFCVSDPDSKKKHYRIRLADIEQFERSRMPKPEPPKPRRRRSRQLL